MTVIATDGRTMAADGLAVDGGGVVCNRDTLKVRKLSTGDVVGLAGMPYDMDPLVEALEDREKPWPDFDKDHFQGLLLKADGTVWSLNHQGRLAREEAPAAVGSGGDLARGMMLAGKSPAEAVELTCLHHSECGGKVVVLEACEERG